MSAAIAELRAVLIQSLSLGAALGAASALFYTSNVLVNKRLVKAFSGSEIMFASTHLDPKSKQYQDNELAFRASGGMNTSW